MPPCRRHCSIRSLSSRGIGLVVGVGGSCRRCWMGPFSPWFFEEKKSSAQRGIKVTVEFWVQTRDTKLHTKKRANCNGILTACT